jgi:hypothetical protein
MEGIRCARAMRRGIGQWIDDLQLLDDRAGPPVVDDERQRIFMFRTNMNKMNVEPVDLGDELRQGVQFRFHLAPVVVRRPIACEFLDRRELHTLRFVRHGFPIGPARRRDASAEVDDIRFGNVDAEGPDSVGSERCNGMRGKEAEGTRGRRGGKKAAPCGG